jgi:uncharacterized protein YqeY
VEHERKKKKEKRKKMKDETVRLVDRINADITAAMRARDQARLAPLRMLKSALTNKSVEKGHGLDDQEAMQVVSTLIKQRRDSIEQFEKGGRRDLADKETAEIGVLEQYLPPPVSDADITAAIDAVVAETGASGPKDVGKVMKGVMGRLAGRTVDGRMVNELVRKRLG